MIRLNSNPDVVASIRQGLEANGGYCPCRVKKTKDTKCMCTEFRQQVSGTCHCGLYIKEVDK